MSETLGQRMERLLSIAVDRELITEEEKIEWVNHPPPNQEQADHRRFILRLIKEAEKE